MDALLFGESAGRIVISCERGCVGRIQEAARRQNVPTSVIGRVGGSRLSLDPWIDEPIEVFNEAWRSGLTKALRAQG